METKQIELLKLQIADPLIIQWLETNEFLNTFTSKLPQPLDQNNGLHHVFFLLQTEHDWTLHNDEYHELERVIMRETMKQCIDIDPLLKVMLDHPIPTPQILFNS